MSKPIPENECDCGVYDWKDVTSQYPAEPGLNAIYECEQCEFHIAHKSEFDSPLSAGDGFVKYTPPRKR